MYIAKMFREILDTVSNFDTEEKTVESEITYSILQWAIKEKKQFLIEKLKLRYANVLY